MADARRPSVLFINQHYAPEHAATGQMLADLSEYLVADGFDVTVLCGQSRYSKEKMEAAQLEVRNGVRVVRVPTSSFGRGHLIGRLCDYATFFAQASRYALYKGGADLVVTLTTPPLLHLAGAVGRLRGRRYGIWSMDLHPDAAVAAGMLRRQSLLSRVLYKLNRVGYQQADFVVALGDHMARRIATKGVATDRLTTIPVWSKKEQVTPVEAQANPLRAELGLEGKTVVMYSGNAGLAHRFEEVTEVMRRLRDRDDLHFLFVGGGPKRGQIVAYAAEHGLRNVTYLDYFPREALSQSLSLGDVHLVTLRDEMAGIAVPSKVYGIMAAARPSVVVAPAASEPAETVHAAGAGVVVDTTDGDDIADRLERVILSLVADPAERAAAGGRARRAFERDYCGDGACAQWARLLRSHAGVRMHSTDEEYVGVPSMAASNA